jgi:YD repeat-containing protein
MRAARRFTAALVILPLAAVVCAGGCLGRKSPEEVRYYRGVGRSRAGLSQGEGPITRKQAGTQEHWRVYTQAGRTIKLAHHDGSGALIEEIRLVYGPSGRVAEENTHSADGRLDESVAFSYDDRGRLVGISRRTAAAGLREQREWAYDELGRLKEMRAYGPRGVLLWRDEFVYDPKHPTKWLGVRRFDKDGTPIKEIPAATYSLWE